MKLLARLLPLALCWLSPLPLFAQEEDVKPGPVLATSNGVEIQSVRLSRERISRAYPGYDLNTASVLIWFPTVGVEADQLYMIKLVELAPIKDDAGTDLLPEARKLYNPFLGSEIQAIAIEYSEGQRGPDVSLLLDAPSKKATKIVAIKGKASIAKLELRHLEFENVAALSGKPLNNPALKKLPIKPTLKFADGQTVLELETPEDHTALQNWGLSRDGEMLTPVSYDEETAGGKSKLRYYYDGDETKKVGLSLDIGEVGEPKLIDFDFKDVELP